MANVVNRTTKEYLKSVNTPDYPVSEWIINPVVPDVPSKYWNISGDTVTEMTQAEKDAVDAAELSQRQQAIRDALKARFDEEDDNTKAMGLLMLQMYQLIRAEIKPAALNNPLPDITPAQLKARFQAIVDSL